MIVKNIFDLSIAFILIITLMPILLVVYIIATISTNENGIFSQIRIGRFGKPFKIYKIKTMKSPSTKDFSSIASLNQQRITKAGLIFRKYKLDELPQLFNVLKRDMSFVGPRPDVIGFADELVGEERAILSVLPGITGPAQIYFKDEEEILNKVNNPIHYNRNVIWPKKIEINLEYVHNWSFNRDIYYLYKTIFS